MTESYTGHTYCHKCGQWHWMHGFCLPAALWHCNECGHDFLEHDAESVDHDDGDNADIACPKCWANNYDEEGSLQWPD